MRSNSDAQTDSQMSEGISAGASDARSATAAAGAGRVVPILSLDQLNALDLLDEPCWLIEIASRQMRWANAAARSFWRADSLPDLQRALLPGEAQDCDRMTRYRQLFAEGRDGGDEWTADGDRCPATASSRVRPVRLADHGPAMLVRVLPSPVAAQAEAERRLAESEQRFRDFAEVSADWYWELDGDLRFSFISPQAQPRTGEDPRALLGRKPVREGLIDVTEDAWRAHTADLAARRAIADFRFAKLVPDGRLRHFSVSAKPIFNEHGAFQGYRGTGRDLTAQVEAEQFLRQVVDSVPAVIAVRDAGMRYLLVNACYAQLLGVKPDDVVGKVTGAYLGQEQAAKVTRRDRQVIESGVPCDPFEMRMANAEGEDRHWLVQKVPLKSAADKVWAVLTVGTDITAQHEAELESDRLRRGRDLAAAADMAKSRFLANMSHELRTPLNAILGFSEMLGTEMFGPLGAEPYRGYVRDIETSGRHLLEIISSLLDMSRIELGDFGLRPEAVAVAGLIDECAAAACAMVPADRAPIVAAPIDPAWRLEVDRRALRQVLTKLLSNALKFTPASGRVTVNFQQAAGGAVAIAVADTGCGIAAERMANLFEPFQHSGAERARTGSGAGLGLWVSRALVELHDGTLTVRSAPGQGTAATVTLPAKRVRQRPALKAAS